MNQYIKHIEMLEKKAKTLTDLLWENELEWNEWLRMAHSEKKAVKLSRKYLQKWVKLEDVKKMFEEFVKNEYGE